MWGYPRSLPSPSPIVNPIVQDERLSMKTKRLVITMPMGALLWGPPEEQSAECFPGRQCPQEPGAARGGGLAGDDTEVQKAPQATAWGSNKRTDHGKKDGEFWVNSLRKTR